MRARESGGTWFFPLTLIVIGVALLLNNFLLLGDFDVTRLLPLILVAAGAQILLRGDLLVGAKPRNFGITRGSVESGTLEISAGEIDIEVRRLQREGRLIAGQFASGSRPDLQVIENHANLKFHRSQTPWLSFSDWQMALATDLPWQLFVTTNLGRVNVDASGLIIHDALLATGLGDIEFTAPEECLEDIQIRSTAGTIRIITPFGKSTRIRVRQTRLSRVHADDNRYQEVEPDIFVALDAGESDPVVEIDARSTFGDIFLI